MAEQFFNKDDQHRNRCEVDVLLCKKHGTTARPAVALANDQTTGLFIPAEGYLGISIEGTYSWSVSAGEMVMPVTGSGLNLKFALTNANQTPQTCNARSGTVVFTIPGDVAGGAFAPDQVINNDQVTSFSAVFAVVMSSNPDAGSALILTGTTPGDGTITLHLLNPTATATGTNFNLTVHFMVMGEFL
jgi:hypothetical protein